MKKIVHLAVAFAAPCGAALADGIDDMCLGAGHAAGVCDCARAAISDAYPETNVTTYEATARHYVASASPATPQGDWDAALLVAADETGMQVNEVAMMSGEVGRAHQTAIRLCGVSQARAEAEAEAAEGAPAEGEATSETPGETEAAPEAPQAEAETPPQDAPAPTQ